jgi:MFS family permease
MGAFTVGYVPVQIPVSLLARRIGEKLMLTINLFAQAAGCGIFPLVARRGGPMALSVLLAAMGAFQASRMPSGNVLRNRWIPDGIERIWVGHVMGYASTAIMAANTWAVPLLAGSRGWRFVVRVYAVQSLLVGLLWHAWGTDRPRDWRGPPRMTDGELVLLEGIGKDAPAPSTSPPSVGAVPPVAKGLSGDTLNDKQLPPLSLLDMCRVPATRGLFIIAAIEALFPRPFLQFDPLYLADRCISNLPLAS